MLRVIGGLVYERRILGSVCTRRACWFGRTPCWPRPDPPEKRRHSSAGELAELLCSVSGNPALAVVSGEVKRCSVPRCSESSGCLPDAGARLRTTDRGERPCERPHVRSSPCPPADADHLAIRPDSGVAHWFGVADIYGLLSDVRTAGVRFAAECLAFANPPSPPLSTATSGSAAAAGHLLVWKSCVPRDRGASWDFEDVRDFYVRAVFGEDPFSVRRVDPERYFCNSAAWPSRMPWQSVSPSGAVPTQNVRGRTGVGGQ